MRFDPLRFRRYARDLEKKVYDLSDATMKFKITEPVFFLHEERAPGDILEHPVGPFRHEPGAGGLKSTPQFLELTELTDRVIAERVIMQMRQEGTLPPASKQPKNPKMRGFIDSMAKFRHAVDCDLDDASKLVEQAHERRKEVFVKVRDHVGDQVAELGDFGSQFDDLEAAIGDNGAPSLDGDSQGSRDDTASLIVAEGVESKIKAEK